MQLRSGYALGYRASEDRAGQLSAAQLEQLAYGVRLVFGRWTALNLAVANQWGGADSQAKAQELVQRVVQWTLEKKEVYADELEEFLDTELMDNWNTQAEDESPREVAGMVTRIFWETCQNQGETVAALARTQTEAQRQIEQSLQEQTPEQVAQEEERLRLQREQRQAEREARRPQVDEDGWTTVTR